MGMSEENKAKYRSAEWMNQMRAKSGATKAANKKIKEAEMMKSKQEREKKLKEAESILNPTPPTPATPEATEEPPEENKPIPKKRQPRVKKEATPQPDLYGEVQQLKSMLSEMRTQAQPAPQPQQQQQQTQAFGSHPYDVAKHDIQQHISKRVMHDLFQSYWPDLKSPYQ